ncbi:integrase arm-type DNA-binding domain-containing protein [Mycoavidus sp. SF9855]|uniref:tyrosine-type recombinase/integrase n=1 Tax=Mycoavidus sp. SF9855 TaxID=2968475 RepID=UPI00211C89BC|nr:integrase arm-type DNA-binding domain-containing protein [Mycoavidus sp. SF9855]UUM20958.1 tyrosine-type recombinase/integrase [Mycoavidus sp. SF9855]
MPTNSLSDARCKAAKPTDKPFKLFDGGGLFLWVSPKGAKIWRTAYRIVGKQQTISFGPYPDVTLAEARAKRDELKAKLREGEDPSGKTEDAKPKLFKDVVSAYWEGREDVTPSYRSNALRGIEMHLYPTLKKEPINNITLDDLLNALRIMDAKGLHVYVRKVRMWVSQVFEWAVENRYVEENLAAKIKSEKAFGKTRVKNFAAVDLREVPSLMSRLALEDQNLQSILACKLLALTWVRTTELRLMEWSEVNVEERIWRIPEGKMKRRKDHLVPLSKQALEILEKMKARSRGSKYVFAAEHRLDRPMSENAILYLLHRIGYKGKMTGHGWRSVGSTWANENGYNRDAIERQLAHSPEDKIRAVYNRAEYLPLRTEILQDWADWLMTTKDNCENLSGDDW